MDQAGWAKQQLLKTFKHHNYSGWKKRLTQEQASKKKPRGAAQQQRSTKHPRRSNNFVDGDDDDGGDDGDDGDDGDAHSADGGCSQDEEWHIHGAFDNDVIENVSAASVSTRSAPSSRPTRTRRARDVEQPPAAAPAVLPLPADVGARQKSLEDLERAAAARAAEAEKRLMDQQEAFQRQMQTMLQSALQTMSTAVAAASSSRPD
eukprot:198569-Pleurochrysis_carterae.AAC.1